MIRAVKNEEIKECVSVIRESFLTVAEEFGLTKANAPRFTAFATTEERLNWQYDEGRPMYVFVNEDEKIIGYYSLNVQENQECELDNLCVLPKYRHLQIGEHLFYHALAQAAEANCTKLNLGIVEENKRLRKWYEKLGAKHIGTKKFDFFPFTCVSMEKPVYL